MTSSIDPLFHYIAYVEGALLGALTSKYAILDNYDRLTRCSIAVPIILNLLAPPAAGFLGGNIINRLTSLDPSSFEFEKTAAIGASLGAFLTFAIKAYYESYNSRPISNLASRRISPV